MPRVSTQINEVTIPFLKLGFSTKTAFINVVTDISPQIIPSWDLSMAWDYGIYTVGLENKLINVLEALKNE